MNYGIFAIIPVAIVLIIAIISRRTILALLCGTAVGAIMIGGKNFISTWIDMQYEALTNETFQYMGLMVIGFGILIVLLEASGAGSEFAIWARRLLKTKKQALIGTFILSVIVFIDDYIHNLVGTTMHPITDSLNIPRSRLGFIVNVMAASVGVLVPVASWAAVFTGLMDAQGITVDGSAAKAYLHAIPYIFYAWISIIIVFLSIIGIIPKIGRVKKESAKAEATGNVFPEGYEEEYQLYLSEKEKNESAGETETTSSKGNPWLLLIPIIVMLITAILSDMDVVLATLMGNVAAGIIYLITKRLTFKEFFQCCYDGCVSMMGMIIIVVLAVDMMIINNESGLVAFLQDVASANLSPQILPVCAFLLCGVYAYVSGSFWDMAMIILPIIAPVAISIGADPILACAAVFSGAAFGSNTCIYSDSLIMCSQAVKVKPSDLMITILPYAAISAICSAILYIVFGFITC